MNILVIYYSQTGQLLNIIEHIVSEIKEQVNIDYCKIVPQKSFPFPWTAHTFFDCMPESVLQIAEPLEPMQIPNKEYDLILLGYSPWFLSPSIPITSFLKSEYATCLANKSVITIIGSRNMWLNAQEKVKAELLHLKAQLVANIVFFDRNPNLVSVLSIVRWAFKGIKEKTSYLPEAGVQKADIEAASRYGMPILKAMQQKDYEKLHTELLNVGSIELQPGLVVLEKRGITNFRKFAQRIHNKGKRGDEARVASIKMFQRLLFIGVFILSPISNLTAKIVTLLHRTKLQGMVNYFKGIEYKQDSI